MNELADNPRQRVDYPLILATTRQKTHLPTSLVIDFGTVFNVLSPTILSGWQEPVLMIHSSNGLHRTITRCPTHQERRP